MVSSESGWIAYTYNPSIAAAVIFVILFAVTTLLHTFHLFRTRTWFFIPLVIGGYCKIYPYPNPTKLNSNPILNIVQY
jgi:hypothetical protein